MIAGSLLLVPLLYLLWFQTLWQGRVISNIDHLVHMRWLIQFETGLQDGWWLPRWAFASHRGLGDPTFLFYQPGAYYLAALFRRLGAAPDSALAWTSWLANLLLGMVVLWRAPSGWRLSQAFCAALFVAASPMLYFMATHQASYPWVLSMPFGLLFAWESAQEKPHWFRLAIPLSLLCLTHLLSTLILLLCVGCGRLLAGGPRRRMIRGHAQWLCICLLGLGLASFFLFPAVTQLHLINPEGWTNNPYLDWHRAFAFPTFTWYRFGMRWFGLQWPLPVVSLLMAAWVLRAPGEQGEAGPAARQLAWMALAGLFFSSELAYPLYELFDAFRKFQWPYRFSAWSLLLSSTAFILVLLQRWPQLARWRRMQALALALAYAVLALYVQNNVRTAGQQLPPALVVMQGDFGQPEYLPAGRGPGWESYLHSGSFASDCAQAGLQCGPLRRTSHSVESEIILQATTSLVRMPLFVFPAWQVSVDGVPRRTSVDPATGLHLVQLPPGQHVIRLAWVGLEAERTGRWITLAALLACLLLWAGGRRSANSS